jgi:hypothetical protein
VTTEPLLLVADLLYALGWSLRTGVVVVFFVQIWPEAKPATPWLEVIALVALVIPFLGWVVGVLVWLSRLWTTGDKLIATLGGLSWVVAGLGGLSMAARGSTAVGSGPLGQPRRACSRSSCSWCPSSCRSPPPSTSDSGCEPTSTPRKRRRWCKPIATELNYSGGEHEKEALVNAVRPTPQGLAEASTEALRSTGTPDAPRPSLADLRQRSGPVELLPRSILRERRGGGARCRHSSSKDRRGSDLTCSCPDILGTSSDW